MVFVTLELNEKMNYIHIQLKRDEVSQEMETAVGCMYFKKKKEEISVLSKSLSDDMNWIN